jgi:hypothetical protein
LNVVVQPFPHALVKHCGCVVAAHGKLLFHPVVCLAERVNER